MDSCNRSKTIQISSTDINEPLILRSSRQSKWKVFIVKQLYDEIDILDVRSIKPHNLLDISNRMFLTFIVSNLWVKLNQVDRWGRPDICSIFKTGTNENILEDDEEDCENFLTCLLLRILLTNIPHWLIQIISEVLSLI